MSIAKTYNLSEIMNRAWSIRRAAAAEMSCKVSEVIMSECLAMAWAEAEGVYAEANAAEIVNTWGDMSDENKVRYITACIRRAAKNEIGYSTEDHYIQFAELPAWGMYGHDFDELISETWLRASKRMSVAALARINEKLAIQGKRAITLSGILCISARAAITVQAHADSKHFSNRANTVIKDSDGKQASAFDVTIAGNKDTEADALAEVLKLQFMASRDEIDCKIIEGLCAGKTERQIAEGLTITNVAVHKRIVKIREAIREMFA